MSALASTGIGSASVCVGGLTVTLRSADARYLQLVRDRYAGFSGDWPAADCEFAVDITEPRSSAAAEDDVRVTCEKGRWIIGRGDFDAEFDTRSRRGRIRQSVNPYALDTLLRIVHTLVLADTGEGFLLHAASAVRGGRAFCFAGVSGAGKTTITRLAPRDVTLLTDEISYVRRVAGRHSAFGTPFAGELGVPGENVEAPLAAVYLLSHGPANRIQPVPPVEAAEALLRNILFFARDPALVGRVFDAACEVAEAVPVYRLSFVPDARVWESIA